MSNINKNKRHFKESGSLIWEVTDKYGDPLPLDVIRDDKICEVLDGTSSLEVIYTITLKKLDERGWGTYSIVFEPRYQILKLYSLAGGDIKVNLSSKTLEESEKLVEMLCKGNIMEVMPAYKK
jgi:hypothetical protein